MTTPVSGLVSFIIPTLFRSKLTSLKTLVGRRFLLDDTLAAIRQNVRLQRIRWYA